MHLNHMGKTAAGNNGKPSGLEFIAPLIVSIIAWFVVVAILLYTETVSTSLQAIIIASPASCAVFCAWYQGTNARARDIKVRTLFRRTSETYTRLKQSLAKKKKTKIDKDGIRSQDASSLVSEAGVLSSSIIEAVRNGDAKSIERWISANNVDSRDQESGSTMLHFAALEDQSRVARLLLKAWFNSTTIQCLAPSWKNVSEGNRAVMVSTSMPVSISTNGVDWTSTTSMSAMSFVTYVERASIVSNGSRKRKTNRISKITLECIN